MLFQDWPGLGWGGCEDRAAPVPSCLILGEMGEDGNGGWFYRLLDSGRSRDLESPQIRRPGEVSWVSGKGTSFKVRHTWVGILAVPPRSCVTLGKFLKLSVPEFYHPKYEDHGHYPNRLL